MVLSEAQLAQRATHVGASEVAALFNLSPWLSLWTLWHSKRGGLPDLYRDDERLEWGNALEPVIAEVLAARQGWRINKVHRYVSHPTVAGMGASLDFEIKSDPTNPYPGRGAFEIKNTNGYSFKQGWNVDEQTGAVLEAPVHYELQLQHQMACTGYQWGAFGVLVDGSKGYVLVRNRHEATIARIEQAVAEFWQCVRDELEPPLGSPIDPRAVAALFGRDGLQSQVVDLSELEEIDALCQQERALAEAESQAKKERKIVCAKLIKALSDHEAEQGVTGRYKLTYNETKRTGYTVEPTSYRTLRVSEIKTKADKKGTKE